MRILPILGVITLLGACGNETDADSANMVDAGFLRAYSGAEVPRPESVTRASEDGLAGACLAIDVADVPANDIRWLRFDGSDGDYHFDGRTIEEAQSFYFKAARLGVYLLYDRDGEYLIDEDGRHKYVIPRGW